MRKWIGILMAVGFCLCAGCGRTASPEASETETSSVVTTAKVQLDAVQTTAAVQEDDAAAVTTKKKTVDVPNGKKLDGGDSKANAGYCGKAGDHNCGNAEYDCHRNGIL